MAIKIILLVPGEPASSRTIFQQRKDGFNFKQATQQTILIIFLGGDSSMGAWGTSIFSDDFAMDVKGKYQVLLAFGTPEEDAFNLTKEYFLRDGESTDDEPVLW